MMHATVEFAWPLRLVRVLHRAAVANRVHATRSACLAFVHTVHAAVSIKSMGRLKMDVLVSGMIIVHPDVAMVCWTPCVVQNSKMVRVVRKIRIAFRTGAAFRLAVFPLVVLKAAEVGTRIRMRM
mmetsp:Transcript_6972/g.10659  ORF Transcript_6972/g.10659 Transcript_6972/m.10659 type:complete len:125 (-) Transcript_6972:85-459(-)